MNFWSYCAPLRLTLSMLDFCAVYFITLLGRCAILSLPVLGIVLLLRKTVLRNSTFAKGAVWGAMLPVLFVGKLSVYYSGSKLYLPLLLWQSWCAGYWWVRYGYLTGVIVSLAVMVHRRRKLHRLLRDLPITYLCGQKVYLCDMTVSPFSAGVLSPKIVLPTLARDRLDESELRTVLLHERTHIRLGHLWCFSLWEVLCALLWVNPLLRLAMPKLKEDMEQICDAVTIQRDGGDALAYGGVILKSMALLRDTSVSLPVAFAGEKDFADAKQRMRRVRDLGGCRCGRLNCECGISGYQRSVLCEAGEVDMNRRRRSRAAFLRKRRLIAINKSQGGQQHELQKSYVQSGIYADAKPVVAYFKNARRLNAVKAADPSWDYGKPFDKKVLDSVTREDVESRLVSDGVKLSKKKVDFYA